MSLYIQQLKAASEAASARQAAETIINRTAEADAEKERMTPLADRLRILLATLPEDVKRGGISLPTIQARLRGRQGRGCQAGELGKALRGLGWTRKRGWRGGDDGGFSALWHPPGSV